ncbi:C4-dicarboxylate-binding periplasmic protein [Vibrio cholerae]|nr:C4-dicarboxylate-binding periplasmic protein [Vibrio cholerae]
MVSFFKSEGINVTYPDLEPFREAMQPLYKEFDSNIGQPIVSKLAAM